MLRSGAMACMVARAAEGGAGVRCGAMSYPHRGCKRAGAVLAKRAGREIDLRRGLRQNGASPHVRGRAWGVCDLRGRALDP